MLKMKKMKLFNISLLMLLAFSSAYAQNTGPGGIKNQTSNRFWFMSSSISQADNTAVNLWPNQGGANTLDAIAISAGQEPRFRNNPGDNMNGLPVLEFRGTDFLEIASTTELNSGVFTQKTFVLAFRTGADVTSTTMLYGEGGGTRGLAMYIENGELAISMWNDNNDGPASPWGALGTKTAVSPNTEYILVFEFNGGAVTSNGTLSGYLNGTLFGTATGVGTLYGHVQTNIGYRLGARRLDDSGMPASTYYNGDIAEIIHYNTVLNGAERIILENYLSSKYDIPIAIDLFTMDTPANGNHSHELIGIGNDGAGGTNTTAVGSGILEIASADDLGNVEALLAAHDNGDLTAWQSAGSPDANTQYLQRRWAFNELGDVGLVDFNLDISGLPALPSANHRYALIYDEDDDMTNGAVIYEIAQVSGNIYSLSTGINIADASYLRIGAVEPAVSFQNTAQEALESQNAPLGIELNFFPESNLNLTIDYTTADGTAIAPGDYSAVSPGSQAVTFAAGSNQTSLPDVVVIDDLILEPDEDFTVTISNGAGYKVGANPVLTHTILDNDNPVKVYFDLASSSANESVTPATLGISLSQVSGVDVTVNWQAIGGTATSPADYTPTSGSTIIIAGNTTGTIDLNIVDDGIYELDETIVVELISVVNGNLDDPLNAVGTGIIEHTYTILNDDPAPNTGYAVNSPTICAGDPATITVSGSEVGISYTLRFDSDNSNATAPVAGTGAAISFAVSPAANTTYNILAVIDDNGLDFELINKSTVTVNALPTITLNSIGNTLNSAADISIPYSSTSGGPSIYSITWDAAALAQGFVNIVNAPLPASPISVPLPANVEGRYYNGNLTVSNGTCSSVNYPINFLITNVILGVEEEVYFAFGLRKLSPSYTGNAIQVRRADGTFRNIGFTASGDLNTADLLSWAGGQSVYVRYFWDQSGNNSYLQQVNDINQPLIVNNGTLITQNGMPALQFDGVDDFMFTNANPPTNNFSVFLVTKSDVTHQIDAESTTGTVGTSGQNYVIQPEFRNTDGGMGISVGTNGISNYEHGASYMPATAVYSGAVNGQNSIGVVYNSRRPSIYLNNQMVRLGRTSPKSTVYASRRLGDLQYGPYDGTVSEYITFATNLSASQVERVQCDQSDYYAISNGCPIVWNGTEYLYGSGTNNAPGTTDGSRNFFVKGPAASLPGDARVNRMTVDAGQDITIPAGTSISIVDFIDNDGTITVESTGSIVQESVNDNNVGAGTYLIERDDIRSDIEFQGWSSPVQSAQLMGPGGVFDGSNPCRTMVWNASSQRWKYDYVPNSVYNCGGGNITFTNRFLMFDDPADNIMDVGRGYFIPGQNGAPTITFSGQINNGTYTKPIFETNSASPFTGDDWNLVGNPYPSALSIPLWLNANSAALSTVAVYLWDDDGSGGVDYDEFDDYAVINQFGFVGGEDGNGTHPIAPVGIATGQGFFIEADAIGNVSFTNAMRITGNNDKFYKTEPDHNPKLWINLKNEQGLQRQTLIGFAPEATFGKDKEFDAPVLKTDGLLSLGTLLENTPMSIQAQPLLEDGDERIIPLYLFAKNSGEYALSFQNNDAFDGIEVYLKTPYQIAEYPIEQADVHFNLQAGINEGYALVFRQGEVLGITEPQFENSWTAFSTDNEVMIQVPGLKSEPYTIELMDVKGVLHYSSGKTNEPVLNISTDGYASGIYFVRLKCKTIEEVKKIVIR